MERKKTSYLLSSDVLEIILKLQISIIYKRYNIFPIIYKIRRLLTSTEPVMSTANTTDYGTQG